MKKIYATAAFLLVANYGFSQFLPTGTTTTDAKYRTGSIGIGTSAAPTAKLEVNSGTTGTSGIKLTQMNSTSATTTGNSKALSVDASGNLILTPVVNTAPATTNIYTADGTLSADRTMTMGGKNLTINPSTANSQFFVNGTSGNVGIGTTTPLGKLAIFGGFPDQSNFIDYNESNKKNLVFNAGSILDSDGYRMMKFFDWPVSNLNLKSEFYFGIDDRAYSTRFVTTAATGGYGMLRLNNRNQSEYMTVYEDGSDNVYMQFVKPNTKLVIGGYNNDSNSIGYKLFVKAGNARVEGNIISDSNIGIGTSNFVDGIDTYRLSVKGNIRAERVRVYTTWADYVFNKDYDLPTLDEVENHIKEKGHLKDIPSAKEVEEKGIELGEMNKLLLQKVEELTLYLIEMNKELKEVKSQIKKD